MFGHHDLYRDGVPARSVIIGMQLGVVNTVGHSKQERIVEGDAIPQETPNQKVFFDVAARVEFGDGMTGEHTERLWRHQVGTCHVGDVLPARYDRQHRDKIVFDLPQLEASRYSPKERADGSAPAQPQPAHVTQLAAFFGGGDAATVTVDDVQGLLGELKADPAGFRAHMRQLAGESGTNTFVFTSAGTSINDPSQQPETGFPVVDLNDEVEGI
jgi:hypothetical protein